MFTTSDLLSKKSHPTETAVSEQDIRENLMQLPRWSHIDGRLEREYSFQNYYETMAFVNAVAYIAHSEDHHPEMIVNYNTCVVRLNTHSVNDGKGGISENDFIVAAKIDAHVAIFLPRSVSH